MSTRLSLSDLYVPLNSQGHVEKVVDSSRALIPRRSLIEDILLEGPIEHREPLDLHKKSRRVAKTVSVLFSAAAKVPYIPISLMLPAGPFLAFSNSFAFFNLEYWAIEGTIDEYLGPRGRAEITLYQDKSIGKCCTVITVLGASVIAILSQIPTALPALDYNGGYKVLGFTVLLIAGALLPIRSLHLSFKKSIEMQHQALDEIRTKLELTRIEMISLVRKHQDFFKQMDLDGKVNFLSKLNRIRQDSEIDRVNAYVLAILEPQLGSAHKANSICGRVTEGISGFVGLWLTVSLQTAFAMYTFRKTKDHLVDDDFAAGVFAGAVVLSGVYLTGQSIIRTTQRMTGSLINFMTCRREKTIAEQIQPRLTVSLKLLGLIFNLAALGPSVVVWGDFYSYNQGVKIYEEITICAAIFLFLSTATLESVDSVIEELTRKRNNSRDMEIIQLRDDLRKFENILTKSSILEVSIFLMKCPAEIKKALLEKTELLSEKLDSFVNESIQD